MEANGHPRRVYISHDQITFASSHARSRWPSLILFSLGRMSELLAGKVQAGFGDASRWLKLFNAAYSEKLGMPVFPGSLNIALDHVFDWFDTRYKTHTIWFGREEYGGERDILLLPCELVSLDHRRGVLVDADNCGKGSTGSLGRRDRS